MKVRLLTENMASDMVWLAEWGFSAWIEHGETRVLFDAGFSDVWARNAVRAGIDVETADVVALSHFHSDHSRGLLFHPFRSRKRLIAHPRVFDALTTVKRKGDVPHQYADIAAKLRADFEVETATGAVAFAPGAFFLGEIPRVTSFEKGAFFDDPMPDDTALAFATARGVVVVSGCSHAGICNICEHAKTVTGLPLRAAIGGFHLLHNEEPPVDDTIAYFKRERPEFLYPVHCIDFDIQAKLQQIFQYERPGAGSELVFSDA